MTHNGSAEPTSSPGHASDHAKPPGLVCRAQLPGDHKPLHTGSIARSKPRSLRITRNLAAAEAAARTVRCRRPVTRPSGLRWLRCKAPQEERSARTRMCASEYWTRQRSRSAASDRTVESRSDGGPGQNRTATVIDEGFTDPWAHHLPNRPGDRIAPRPSNVPWRVLVEMRGLEPLTPAMRTRCSPS